MSDLVKKKNTLMRILIGIISFIIPVIGIIRIAKEKKGTVGSKIVTSIFFLIFWMYALSLFYFVFWTFYNSVKIDDEFFEDMISLPTIWRFSNYVEAYKFIDYNEIKFPIMFVNSIWFSVGSSLLTVFSHAVTGYIFAKYKFPGREVAFKVILFTIALPIVGSLPSLYKIVYTIGIEDSPLFLITYLGGFGSNFLVTYAFFSGIDKTYMEAAEIDGASRFGIFFRIMLPLAVAPCFALFLLTFINQWNNYETAILFLDAFPTLSSGLYHFSEYMKFSETSSPYTVYFAGILLASVPVIILVACFGDKLMSNVSMGGIKG